MLPWQIRHPHLSSRIPLIRQKSLKRLLSSTAPPLSWASTCPAASSSQIISHRPISFKGVRIQSKEQASDARQNALCGSFTGRHISCQQFSAPSDLSITSSTRIIPQDFIHRIKLECYLSTKTRRSRGQRSADDTLCWGAVDSQSPYPISYNPAASLTTHGVADMTT
ncbi:hypothetical protein D915_007030 [Fasciola hepatica]|uniref:Uncharacterized protein n=1 Tax=Fasciola hepatica TaxID=6192 RepID=A0A4E0RMD4_FASHE|nr:hypothetical protein D915_007030 [Fasciola hepatica]